jgi:hypothetical protein
MRAPAVYSACREIAAQGSRIRGHPLLPAGSFAPIPVVQTVRSYAPKRTCAAAIRCRRRVEQASALRPEPDVQASSGWTGLGAPLTNRCSQPLPTEIVVTAGLRRLQKWSFVAP